MLSQILLIIPLFLLSRRGGKGASRTKPSAQLFSSGLSLLNRKRRVDDSAVTLNFNDIVPNYRLKASDCGAISRPHTILPLNSGPDAKDKAAARPSGAL